MPPERAYQRDFNLIFRPDREVVKHTGNGDLVTGQDVGLTTTPGS